MSPRRTRETGFDKFLGFFGIRRPKKRKTSARKTRKRTDEFDNTKYEVPINDNFQIVNEQNNKEESNANSNRSRAQKKVPSKSKSKNSKKRNPFLRVVTSCLLIMVITICIVIAAGMIYLFAFIDDSIDADLYNLKLDYTTILYAKDKEGKDVELTRLHGEQNRLWVSEKEIPDIVDYAFISCEDKRFKDHHGVDWKRTFFAFANEVFDIRDNRQGGSTITQQLVKNLTQDDDIDAARKIREIMRARKLEQLYDKSTILECYLNTIHLGNGVDGIEVASNYYFDKHASDINLTQAACLAAITNNPSENEPYNNPENNKSRRNWVLDEMCNNGYITKEECEKAKQADLELRKNPSTILSTTEIIEKDQEYNSYFVDAVIEDVVQCLMEEKGYTEEFANTQLYQGGYKVYTTVDLEMQEILEDVYSNDSNFVNVYTSNGDKAQSAMTIMDYNGNVKAVVGGRGKKDGNRVLNRATQSPRPTGSAIKPISVYAPAFEYNVITWASNVIDAPITKLENGVTPDEPWPRNYDGKFTNGKTSMLRARKQSLNTVPVRILQDMTIDTSYKFVTEKMGLKHFVVSENGQSDKTESSLALGGSVHGATTLEMAAAFSTFGSGGIYYKPRTYSKIVDQSGEVVIDNTKTKHRAISEATATIMNKFLQNVATSGTGTSAQFGGWEIMCKTGTTSNNKDRWFVGGTPHYVAACWFGVDSNVEMYGMYTNPAIVLWKAAMSRIHENLEYKKFEVSDQAVFKRFCTSSGKCARSGCSGEAYGYFKKSYTPYCNYHGGYELGEAVNYGFYGGYDYEPSTTSSTSKTKATETTAANASSVQSTASSGSNGENTPETTIGATNENQDASSAEEKSTKKQEKTTKATKATKTKKAS